MIYKHYISTLFFLLGCVLLCFSQTYNSTSPSLDINTVDDKELTRLINKAQELGLSQSQLEQLALQRGVSLDQIGKLKHRLGQSKGRTTNDQSFSNPLRLENSTIQNQINNVPDTLILVNNLKIFGSDIFRQTRNNLNFTPIQNVATPENYILGPGDEIIIDIYGSSEIKYVEIISPDGTIFISGVGPITLSGTSISNAKKKIFNKLITIYSDLQGSKPNTFLQVSLGNIRTIMVDVVGHVKYPGTYNLSSFATAFIAFHAAGGPSELGSMRSIHVMRAGKQIATLDIYKYFFNGDNTNNPRLRDEDIIVVKPYINRVFFVGAVKYPAVYEFKPNETLDYLMELSGGFSANAYVDKLRIIRKTGLQKKIKTVTQSEFAAVPLMAGDEIEASSIIDRFENKIQITGAVKVPNTYELKKKTTLFDIISDSEGLLPNAYLGRGNITRIGADFTLENISFNVKEVIEGKQNYDLQPDDSIHVFFIDEIKEYGNITILGEVREPGIYPFKKRMTVEDLLTLSKGLTPLANRSFIEVARQKKDVNGVKIAQIYTFPIDETLSLSDTASSFLLASYDYVTVKADASYRKQQLVEIEGEVNNPGYYVMATHEDRLVDLVKRSGGLTKYAYPKGAILIRSHFDTGEKTYPIKAGNYRREGLDQIAKTALLSVNNEKINIDQNSDSLLLTKDRTYSIGISLDKALKDPSSKFNVFLQKGDILSIPKQLQTITVHGEVLHPSTLRYDKTYSFRKYIALAGGTTENALLRKSYIVYANGDAYKTKKFLLFKTYPKIEPGADIFVTVKTKRQYTIGDFVGLSTSLLSLVLLINTINF